jgi:hypothetical protein
VLARGCVPIILSLSKDKLSPNGGQVVTRLVKVNRSSRRGDGITAAVGAQHQRQRLDGRGAEDLVVDAMVSRTRLGFAGDRRSAAALWPRQRPSSGRAACVSDKATTLPAMVREKSRWSAAPVGLSR